MAQEPKESSRVLARFRVMLWALVAIVAVGATGLYFIRPPANPLGVTGTAFSAETTDGARFTEADLRGTPSLVFFGFTWCPDVCPTSLAEMTAIRADLGYSPDQLRIIFATVDPERDTPQVLADYLGTFDPTIVGLTGTEAEVEATKAAFGVYSEKGEDDGSGTYLVDHTASVFLIGADGGFAGTIAYTESRDTARAKVERLVEG
ncbi:SCO family protein [Arsenicitalea aurantiaca]|uniref:SCO family protein n=1 Tax=Arsenicitalea aurantiaca TaxID=1783274 RepID=A0A433XAL0_9HYPH|nr:SCO family protein [Arsenicitalea aurantiaca]RUT31116.1 SCO family protein [Arsenicitalea aurantiaca]